MRAWVTVVVALFLAGLVLFLGQAYFASAGGDDQDGVANITIEIAKDTENPFVNLRLERAGTIVTAMPFDLRGYVCDPMLPDGTLGVGLTNDVKVNITINGALAPNLTNIGVGDDVGEEEYEFFISDFHEYLPGDWYGSDRSWNIKVEAQDALGNTKKRSITLEKYATGKRNFKVTADEVGCSGGCAWIQTWWYNSVPWIIPEEMDICVERHKGLWDFRECEGCKDSRPAKISSRDESGWTGTVFDNVCCCDNGICGCGSHSLSLKCKHITDYHEKLSGLKAQVEKECWGWGCVVWCRQDIDELSGTIHYNRYKFTHTDAPTCGQDFGENDCTTDSGGLCTGYEFAICTATANPPEYPKCGTDTAILEVKEVYPDATGCDKYYGCACIGLTNCEVGEVCDNSTNVCVAGCNSTCANASYDGGMCLETGYPSSLCSEDSLSVLGNFQETGSVECGGNTTCVCYIKENCTSGKVCIDGECNDCNPSSGGKCEGYDFAICEASGQESPRCLDTTTSIYDQHENSTSTDCGSGESCFCYNTDECDTGEECMNTTGECVVCAGLPCLTDVGCCDGYICEGVTGTCVEDCVNLGEDCSTKSCCGAFFCCPEGTNHENECAPNPQFCNFG